MNERRRPDPKETEETDEPSLAQISRDERDEGWGDEPPDTRRDDEWYLRERPPHHE
jgi:hypothetical protein